MELYFAKDDNSVLAFFIAAAIAPIPYTVIDEQHFLRIVISDDLSAVRAYRLGVAVMDVKVAVTGIRKAYGPGGKYDIASKFKNTEL